jgi:RNA polymerase sigma factor (sigma-70 family)
MSNGSETEFVVRQCREGEPKALGWLRLTHQEPLRNILLARGATLTEVDDLLADLWADCVVGTDDKPALLDKFKGRCSLRGWLATVLTNRWIDLKRKEQRRAELPSDGELPIDGDTALTEAHSNNDDSLLELLHRSIEGAFARAPAQAIVILRLVHEHGLTQREVCRMAGWSEAKVSRLMSEAMAQIRADALKAIKTLDPWLELSWDDLEAMCEIYQSGFY